MAHGGGHAVLVSGLPGGPATEELLGALHAAGHRPLAVGVPAAAAEEGRCYVTFHEAAEADQVCRRHGAIRIHGRALKVTRLFGVGWGPEVGHADVTSDVERPPWPPLLPARRAAPLRRPATAPLAPPGPAGTGAVGTGRVRSVQRTPGPHLGHLR